MMKKVNSRFLIFKGIGNHPAAYGFEQTACLSIRERKTFVVHRVADVDGLSVNVLRVSLTGQPLTISALFLCITSTYSHTAWHRHRMVCSVQIDTN